MSAEVQSRLPAGYALDRQGVPRRRRERSSAPRSARRDAPSGAAFRGRMRAASARTSSLGSRLARRCGCRLGLGRQVEREAERHHVIEVAEPIVLVDLRRPGSRRARRPTRRCPRCSRRRAARATRSSSRRSPPCTARGPRRRSARSPMRGSRARPACRSKQRDLRSAARRRRRPAHASNCRSSTSARSSTPTNADAAEDVEVGVDEQLLEDAELAAQRDERELRRRDPLDVADLLGEVVRVRQAEDVDLVGLALGRRPRRSGRCRCCSEREAAPGADAEPVGRVEHQLAADQHGARELVLQRHRRCAAGSGSASRGRCAAR